MAFIGYLLSGVVFIGILFLYFMYVTSPKKGRGNKERVDLSIVSTKWTEIQGMLSSGGPANYRQSIMEADKLVDLVLKSKVSGETMGERLKNAKPIFSKDVYDRLWTAHKIRNKVAHEADFEGLGSDATLAVRNFEKALRELKSL
jgi:hypothetical protein